MEITIRNTETGQELSLFAQLAVIPEGYTLIVCPADKDSIILDRQRDEMIAAFAALDISAYVSPVAIAVWAIAENARR